MIRRDSIIQAVAGIILIGCLALSGVMLTALSAEAGRAQLSYTDQAQEGDPPEVALGIALGAFRGLFVNYLWLRANKLKEEGKFYEAIELSSAITRLQPRFPRVWAFHAWNMAYNISVATNTAQERWQWVRAGINLLRKQGIPRNPNDVLLTRELAWIFIHKIQGWSDDANHYYKRQLAREWTIVLGAPPERSLASSREDATQAMIDFLRPIADAPSTLEGVIRAELEETAPPATPGAQPAARSTQNSLVRQLVDRIRREAGIDLGFDLLAFVAQKEALGRAWYVEELDFEGDPTDQNRVINELLADPRYEDAWRRLLPFVRRNLLLTEYNMEPERMIRYTERFGPIDWRHPATHSLYWASRGVDEGIERRGSTQFDTLNTDRISLHSIQELFRFGHIQHDFVTGEYFTLPNFDFTDTYNDHLDKLRTRAGFTDDPERAYRLYSAGYENFLRDVIRVAYNRGERDIAEYYHHLLRTGDWLNVNDPDVFYELQELTLDEFVAKQLEDRISIPHVAVGEIESSLTQAYLEGLLQNRPRLFRAHMEYAARAWEAFRSEQGIRTTADPESIRMLEYVGEHFAVIASRTLVNILIGGRIGLQSAALGPFQRAELWRKVPTEIQLAAYDDLVRLMPQADRSLTEEAFKALFPEPPGLEEFRARRQQFDLRSDEWLRRQIQFQTQ